MFSAYLKNIVQKQISQLRNGAVSIHDVADGAEGLNRRFPRPLDRADASNVQIDVLHPSFYRSVACGGALGAAEAYLQGKWECANLTGLFRTMIRNMQVTDHLDKSPLTALRRMAAGLQNWLNRNTPRGSKRNIASHYDLGNEFYKLWLDETLTYSAGIFRDRYTTMQQASQAKLERACRLLNLGPQDHLLEIGSGWGALSTYAARRFGCRVTTTTISEEQYSHTQQLVEQLGLGHRVKVLKSDYRDLEGKFDKIVSIEMIEAVGHRFLPTFFEKCGQLLAPGGDMVLQSIVIADERFAEHKNTVDFMSYYIFPGGALPSKSRLIQFAAEAGHMNLERMDAFGPHYAETLRRWRAAFTASLEQVREQGFDERFIRMWHYYLCYCEAAFDERQVDCVQIHYHKRDLTGSGTSVRQTLREAAPPIPQVDFLADEESQDSADYTLPAPHLNHPVRMNGSSLKESL